MIKQITIEQLKAKQASGQPFCFLDVRSREEWEEANIPGARLFLDMSHAEIDVLDKNTDIIFQCRSGGRSQKMAEAFEQRGFTNLSNLSGGILAWQQHS
jgi:adenylyltransferase/sulfurtransferase